ncbi:hypothetical protein ACFWP1_23535 [Streptomyces sp. NPDC058425]|uniref:hypothetical protein n=1 Tax=unclassified Streptomyces TaxID=2593676 RepID=UPI00365DCE8E
MPCPHPHGDADRVTVPDRVPVALRLPEPAREPAPDASRVPGAVLLGRRADRLHR